MTQSELRKTVSNALWNAANDKDIYILPSRIKMSDHKFLVWAVMEVLAGRDAAKDTRIAELENQLALAVEALEQVSSKEQERVKSVAKEVTNGELIECSVLIIVREALAQIKEMEK